MNHPAQYIVTTVNGAIPCCAVHAAKLSSLMRFIGSYADVRLVEKSAECANCVNEAKKVSNS